MTGGRSIVLVFRVSTSGNNRENEWTSMNSKTGGVEQYDTSATTAVAIRSVLN